MWTEWNGKYLLTRSKRQCMSNGILRAFLFLMQLCTSPYNFPTNLINFLNMKKLKKYFKRKISNIVQKLVTLNQKKSDCMCQKTFRLSVALLHNWPCLTQPKHLVVMAQKSSTCAYPHRGCYIIKPFFKSKNILV